MADKREIRLQIKKIEKIRTWQLVILLIMVGFLCLTFLRLNNIGMTQRREAVKVADELGDDNQIEQRLYDLQTFVSAHMNSYPQRISLEHKYQRDNDKLKAKLETQTDENPHGNVYKKAADVCDPIGRARGWRYPSVQYVDCLNKELAKYPSANILQTDYKPLPVDLYYHTFVSPVWSPDLAGFSILLFFVILIMIIVRIFTVIFLRIMLKSHYKDV